MLFKEQPLHINLAEIQFSLGVGDLSDHPDGASSGAGQNSFLGMHF